MQQTEMARLQEIQETIGLLATSESQNDVSHSYAHLLQFLEEVTRDREDGESALHFIKEHLASLLNSILRDIAQDDEEIASQALKSLGFVLYHPLLARTLSEENVSKILQSLVEIITCTRMKAICNLATWCISIQQLKDDVITSNICSLVRGVAHALANPMCSKSVTFEAHQAVIKLGAQSPTFVRNLSHIWCPPIYRKLVSSDKRERDMSERCLQKFKSNILPPLSQLSKIVSEDVHKMLLTQMGKLHESNVSKVYMIQAWAWFIQLLGELGIKSKTLVNKMLKIPEQTFADPDPQVCIASLVSWETFIDAIFQHEMPDEVDNLTLNPLQDAIYLTKAGPSSTLQSFIRRLKLIMKPLVGIISSKYDVALRISCLKTWNYVLHRLDFLMNSPTIIEIVLEPVLKAIFKKGPKENDIWIWNFAVDLIEKLASVHVGVVQDHVSIDFELSFSIKQGNGTPVKMKGNQISWLCIKWFPLRVSLVEFLLKNAGFLWRCQFMANGSCQFHNLTLDAILRIFRANLMVINSDLHNKDEVCKETSEVIHLSVNFVQALCQDIKTKQLSDEISAPYTTVLSLIEAMNDALHPSLLVSSSFKIPLDVNTMFMLKTNKFPDGIGYEKIRETFGINSSELHMVVPVIFLTVSWISLVASIPLDSSEETQLLEKITKIIQTASFTDYLLENLNTLLIVLYEVGLHANFNVQSLTVQDDPGRNDRLPFKTGILFWLRVWEVIAKTFKDLLESGNDHTFYEARITNTNNQIIYNFLLFPIHASVICSFSKSDGSYTDMGYYTGHVGVDLEIEVERILRLWRSLYNAARHFITLKGINANIFAEVFSKKVLKLIDDGEVFHQCLHEIDLLQPTMLTKPYYQVKLLAEFTGHVMKQVEVTCPGRLPLDYQRSLEFLTVRNNSEGDRGGNTSNVTHVLALTARFLDVTHPHANYCCLPVARVFDSIACFLRQISSQKDILLFLQKLSNPLAKWLDASSKSEIICMEGSLTSQIEKVWNQFLNCLQRSQPQINFSSEFLNVLAPLLIPAYQHRNTSIANATIAFWEATYENSLVISHPANKCILAGSVPKIDVQGSLSYPVRPEHGNTFDPAADCLKDTSNKFDTRIINSEMPENADAKNDMVSNDGLTVVKTKGHANFVGKKMQGTRRMYHSLSAETAQHMANNDGDVGSYAATNALGIPLQKKKPRLCDSIQDAEYVVIPPPIERKTGPLTE